MSIDGQRAETRSTGCRMWLPGWRCSRGADDRLRHRQRQGLREHAAVPLRVRPDAWIVFEDEAGQTLRPPRARTWARRGHTPVVRVSGKGSGRISVAGLLVYRTGERPHLYYRLVSCAGDLTVFSLLVLQPCS